MRLVLALKMFFKGLKNPQAAQLLLEKKEDSQPSKKSSNAQVQLLALLQKEGRLIDFFKEDISKFSDAQVGAAVRQIHQDCSNCLEEFVTLRPLFTQAEGDSVTVPTGYDPSSIKVVGKVKGNPPYTGILRHKGWKAHKLSLPEQLTAAHEIVCPAEIEVQE